MPHFNDYERNGIRLMVEFTCFRCKGTRVEPLEPLVPNDEGAPFLRNLKRPEGWSEIDYSLFCPTCTYEFKEFMMAGVKGGAGQ